MFKKIFLFIFLLITQNVLSAEVVDLRGEATVLLPGEKSAVPATLKMRLTEDSSILTKEKSFMRIKLDDGSIISLGPSSKIVIQKIKTDNAPSMISLLRGQIRANVEKGIKKEEVKMVIKNKQAAMGVRGTEFLVVFDPDTQASSLVTFEGKVAITKPIADEKLVEELAKTDKTIGAGEFAGLNKDLGDKPIEKVKVADDQLKILKGNMGLDSDSKGENVTVGDGKVIDFKTGLAVPSKSGFIDLKTGIFTPIAGLNLTTKGFVPKNKENDSTLELSTRFNNGINNNKYYENKLISWVNWYSIRSELSNKSKTVTVQNNDSLRVTTRLSRSDLYNTYYIQYSFLKSNFKSMGCSNCGSGIYGNIEKSNYSSLSLGLEKRLNSKLNYYLELGVQDRLTLEDNNVFKELGQKASIGGKYKFSSQKLEENFYPYVRANADVLRLKGNIGLGGELGAGGELKIKSNVLVFGEVFVGRENMKNHKFQTGGLGIGFGFDF